MLNKEEKIKFVENAKKTLEGYSTIGVVPLSGVPDRLLQSSRNKMRSDVRFMTGKKSLLVRVLEGNPKTKSLAKDMTGTSAIIMTNDDPFTLFKKFKATTIKLAAKPNQMAPDDISIMGGETGVQPGQAVTELKQAGIDVQIQKGKVVIAKDKVLVKKGSKISPSVAKALKTLDIMPFSIMIAPSVLLSDGLSFGRDILDIDPAKTMGDIALGFNRAFTLSLAANVINAYTIRPLLEKGARIALKLGLESKAPEPGIVELLVQQAAQQASALNAAAPKQAAE
jgi:large subunit ribosomal protein L10